MKLTLGHFPFWYFDFLVFADLPSPAMKILFDGESDIFVAEGFDVPRIEYRILGDTLFFKTKNNSTLGFEFMVFKTEARRKSFAVENFLEAPDYDYLDQKFCHENSSENLRGLIAACFNQIRARNLTEEERKQLQKLKNTSSAKKPFKVIYDRRAIRTQTVGENNLRVEYFQIKGESVNTKGILVDTNDFHGDQSKMFLEGDLTSRSFVIEGQLPTSGDCRDADPSDLKPTSCSGNVRIRPLNESDKPI